MKLNKIEALKRCALEGDKFGTFLVFNSVNLTYFAGFQGAAALSVTQSEEPILYVSSVNYEQAKTEVKDFTIELLKSGDKLMEKMAKRSAPSKKIAVDSLPIESWRVLATAIGGEERLEPAGNIIRSLRMVKDHQELELIREACNLANLGMKVASENIHSGMKEREIAAEVEYAMRKNGSDGTSFDTIIASGPSSAFPHGSCGNRTIRDGDFVIVDLGATYQFYRSDMTRTFVAGNPTEKQKKIYETVKLANQEAFETIKPNVSAAKVDMAARRIIESEGFGEFFVHSLGHGVGLEIHEAPVLGPDSKDVLARGNTITDEPGIYLPGYGGVRIEDTVLVTEESAEKLTKRFYTLTDES